MQQPGPKLKTVNKHVGPISDLKMSAGKIRRSHNTEWCNKPLHKCTYYRVFLSAEPTRYQIQKQNFDLSPKGFNRISAVQSTFLLLQSSDCTSSCTWLQTRKKPKEQKYAGYGWGKGHRFLVSLLSSQVIFIAQLKDIKCRSKCWTEG